MRTVSFAAIAAVLFAGSFAASAQTATKTAAVTCKGLEEAACQAPDCKWNPATTTKKGKEKKAYCSKAAKSSSKKTASKKAA